MKEIGLLIAAIVLSCILYPIGVLYIFLKAIFTMNFKRLVTYPWYVLKQVWKVFRYFCLGVAISFDMLGNVLVGEMIEDVVTTEDVTLYGDGEYTISEATGELESRNKLDKDGKKFSSVLSRILGKNHCIESYQKNHVQNAVDNNV